MDFCPIRKFPSPTSPRVIESHPLVKLREPSASILLALFLSMRIEPDSPEVGQNCLLASIAQTEPTLV